MKSHLKAANAMVDAIRQIPMPTKSLLDDRAEKMAMKPTITSPQNEIRLDADSKKLEDLDRSELSFIAIL